MHFRALFPTVLTAGEFTPPIPGQVQAIADPSAMIPHVEFRQLRGIDFTQEWPLWAKVGGAVALFGSLLWGYNRFVK